jgi:2-polyprenyl-3-methyl-5-hydroxy-6-metoxy-1,4-benzoquinol methylase
MRVYSQLNDDAKFPHAKSFSKSIGIPEANLIRAFHIEREFHSAVLSEESFKRRLDLYRTVYTTVHPIYGKTASGIMDGKNPKDRQVRLFRKELSGKSILDVGCGEGYFLASIARKIRHKRLMGIDVSIPLATRQHPEVEFISGDIIDFRVDEEFDVVFADQVLEHIAPRDLVVHLNSIKKSLRKGGLFIVLLPNRLFGPSDVTRIIDFSYSNQIAAQGTHLNESTYTELMPLLGEHGFGNFKTIVPIRKIKHLLSFLRINPSLFMAIENSDLLMKILYAIKFRGQCFARFDVVLICEKLYA